MAGIKKLLGKTIFRDYNSYKQQYNQKEKSMKNAMNKKGVANHMGGGKFAPKDHEHKMDFESHALKTHKGGYEHSGMPKVSGGYQVKEGEAPSKKSKNDESYAAPQKKSSKQVEEGE